MTTALGDFASEVGGRTDGPVVCAGGRTQWTVGLEADPGPVREVAAPAGVVAHEPGEMIVRVRAGTTLAELDDALARGDQMVALEADEPAAATVGGLLACGRSGLRRLGRGPVRDAVLEVTVVSAAGELVRAGAPLVKNVTGYDLCRLLVGSIGTLGFLAEVVLRCRPRPEAERWFQAVGADPFALHRDLYRPLAVLWDGRSTWVGLEGYAADVEDQAARVLGPAFAEVDGPPPRPGPGRSSLDPGRLRELADGSGPSSWLAEVGVGVVHGPGAPARPAGAPAAVVALHRRIKDSFDPSGRLNPGRSPLAVGA